MKKIVSFTLIALMGAMIFAASFKKGQTVYVSKDGSVMEAENSSKKVGTVTKGDNGVVISSNSKKTEIQFNDTGLTGWFDTKNLTKKKIVKATVSTNLDNIALSGKGKAKNKKAKTEEVKTEEVKAIETEVTSQETISNPEGTSEEQTPPVYTDMANVISSPEESSQN